MGRVALAAKVTHLAADEAVVSPEAAAADGEKLTIEVQNPLGLHARPAARFVQSGVNFDI